MFSFNKKEVERFYNLFTNGIKDLEKVTLRQAQCDPDFMNRNFNRLVYRSFELLQKSRYKIFLYTDPAIH